MARWSNEEIWRRAGQAETRRSEYWGWVDEALAYAMPWRRKRGGRRDFDRLFDSSAPRAVMRFANRMQREFTPPFQRWMELKAGPMVPEQLHQQVNTQLEVATRICLAILDASAFAKASQEGYGDLSIGEMGLLFAEGDDLRPVRVTASAPWELGTEEGPDGTIWNVFFKRCYPAWQLPELWKGADWPKDIAEKIAGDQKTAEVEVLQASYYDTEDHVWRLAVMTTPSSDAREVCWERERRCNPWVIPRWWTSPGNPRGFGPLLVSMPDIRTANKTVEFILRAAAYQLAPPLMVLHDGVINPDRMKVAPSGLIQVARTGGPMGRSIEPLDIGSKLNVGQIVLEDQRLQIAKNLLDQGLPPQTGAVRSASEIIGRLKELSYDSGAAFGRLNHEMVPGVVSNVIDILDRKKVSVINWNDLRIDHLQLRVNVISPLARVQSLDDAQQMIQAAETVRSIFGQEVLLHSFMVEDMPAALAEYFGVKPSLVRPKAERTALEQAAGKLLADPNGDQGQAAAVQPAAPSQLALPAPGAF